MLFRKVGLEVGSSAWSLWWVWRVLCCYTKGVGGGRRCLVVVVGNVNRLGPWKGRSNKSGGNVRCQRRGREQTSDTERTSQAQSLRLVRLSALNSKTLYGTTSTENRTPPCRTYRCQDPKRQCFPTPRTLCHGKSVSELPETRIIAEVSSDH